MSAQAGIVACDVVRHGVLRLSWDDGYTGVASLHCTLEAGGAYGFLTDAAAFARVRVAADRSGVFWTDPDGDRVGFSSESLRARAQHRSFDAAA